MSAGPLIVGPGALIAKAIAPERRVAIMVGGPGLSRPLVIDLSPEQARELAIKLRDLAAEAERTT